MAEMLTDLLQNIYGRISQLGKSIQGLQASIDALNSNFVEKVSSLVSTINEMTESVKKEADAQNMIFREMGDRAVEEVSGLKEKIGLKDLQELAGKLNTIVSASEEMLRPETVDVLLHETLSGIKALRGEDSEDTSDTNSDELLDKVNESLNSMAANAENEENEGKKKKK